ncbi:MAG: succinylglutamate desuccinylase/aspartoacylase family protein, partial [Acidobacteriota bacterium]
DTVIIQEIFRQLKKDLIRGSLHAFPLMNPFGFENISRNVSLSQEDLNRSFPGKVNGTLAERMALIIFDSILKTKPDLVLDLHNDWIKSIPYVLIDKIPITSDALNATDRFFRKSGLIRILDTDVIKTTLSYNLLERDIPALTLELGESFTINERNIEIGFNVIWNILYELNMVGHELEMTHYHIPQKYKNTTLRYSAFPYCSRSGILRFLKKPGEVVKKGQKIAHIYNAFGKRIETIKALNEGIILGQTDHALSYPGAPVMAFGLYDPGNESGMFGLSSALPWLGTVTNGKI